MPRTAIEPGLLSIPQGDEPPKLLGSRCDGCGAVFHPPRPVCIKCYGQSLSDVSLQGQGAIYACTLVQGKLRPSLRTTKEYWVAQVDLDEGPRVQGILAPNFADPRIGTRVGLALETLRTDEHGSELVVHHFCRAGGSK
jgi:uncharacterized OB-fold protein